MSARCLVAVLGILWSGCRSVPEVYPALEDSGSAQGESGGSGEDGGGGDEGSGSDEGGSDDSGSADDTGLPERDWWEGWPQSTFFPTYCGACHPEEGGSAWDFTVYDHVVYQRDHIVCGVGLEDVPECYADDHEDPHEPTSLPRGSGAKPTAAERQRLVDWMKDGMPMESDL